MFACVPFDRNGEKRDGGRGVGGGSGALLLNRDLIGPLWRGVCIDATVDKSFTTSPRKQHYMINPPTGKITQELKSLKAA